MHAKNNRQNSNFQIAYFLAGSCHTADGAYALLCDQRADRADALAEFEAYKLREIAKIIRAKQRMKWWRSRATRLEAAADLREIDARRATLEKNVTAARAELAFIDQCISDLQPHRRFGNLPDAEAHQAAQQEEWCLELIYRAENFLLTGGIPADHFSTMRMHPEWGTRIFPALEKMRVALRSPEAQTKMLTDHRPNQFSSAKVIHLKK